MYTQQDREPGNDNGNDQHQMKRRCQSGNNACVERIRRNRPALISTAKPAVNQTTNEGKPIWLHPKRNQSWLKLLYNTGR
jgi:hypothetical protein